MPIGIGKKQLVTSSFVPPAGLVLWLKGDAGVEVSGGDILSWTDQVASYLFSYSVVPPPFLTPSTLNGIPCVESPNTFVSNLTITGPSMATIMGAATSAERFIAFAPTVPQDYGLFSLGFGTAPGGSFLPYANGNLYDGFASTTRQAAGPSGPGTLIYDSISTDTEWTALVNGTQIFTTPTNTYVASPDPLNLLIQWAGLLGEIMIFNHKLSTSDRTNVDDYLGRWK